MGLTAATLKEVGKIRDRLEALGRRLDANNDKSKLYPAEHKTIRLSRDVLEKMGFLHPVTPQMRAAAMDVLKDPDSALSQWSQIYRNQAAVDMRLEIEMMPAIDEADLSKMEQAAAEWKASEKAIEDTRAALEVHQRKAPKDRAGVAAWSAKRGELQSALDSYTAIAEAHKSSYYGLSWKVGQALREYTLKEFAAAEKDLEKADIHYRQALQQAREARRPAVARVEGLRRLLQRIEAGSIGLFEKDAA